MTFLKFEKMCHNVGAIYIHGKLTNQIPYFLGQSMHIKNQIGRVIIGLSLLMTASTKSAIVQRTEKKKIKRIFKQIKQ